MFGKSSILFSSKMSALIGFQDDADWLNLGLSAHRSDQSMQTDLRQRRLVGKAQSPTVKMLLESFPSSFWIFATSCAQASGGNIFSIWIVEKIEVDGICKRTRNNEPIPSTNRTRNMFHSYIRHHVTRTAKILKDWWNCNSQVDFERARLYSGDSDVGDMVMLVTLWWWLISDVGGRIIMLATFFVMLVIFSMY